ncbi:hypothetical protein N7462_000125 [Penicillium macrosclerotiorum]|uniref:uncharacterized protein n=1 Tax=Penicillium macrosclerotiorum TaxID=303699 RepID=UPI002547610D|nr:uncharacterized protein N7462_000125 [Penicillium macrosclerotiorum]KAJ5698120.1 hypothetical protein N7462_000125 [Penicillium macrosclerotiorum]
MDFYESSFFQEPNKCLPTPEQVKALSKDIGTTPQPQPVKFKNSGVFVKFGPYVTIAEAQCLWMIKKAFSNQIPVPEIFGWRVDEQKNVFLYMELIQGRTLLESWDTLDKLDKSSLVDQLRQIVQDLRSLEQNPLLDPYIGSISGQRVQDYVFESFPNAGPFASIKDFNDWFASLPQTQAPNKFEDPYRHLLPDSGTIKFTHADLHRGNIMVSSSKPVRILAVVDWGLSGWYPDYWEFCKACYTSYEGEEWRQEWINEFLCPSTQAQLAFSEYIMILGAF